MHAQGQALVQFKDAQYVKKCIDLASTTTQQLDGKKVTVTQSKFPAIMDTFSQSSSSQSAPHQSFSGSAVPASVKKTAAAAAAAAGGATTSTVSSFKPRRLAMVPKSAVKSKPSIKKTSSLVTGDSGPHSSVNAADKVPDDGNSTATKSNAEFRKFFQ
jgi:hypothetical protein